MEIIIIGLFCAALLFCVVLDLSILYALVAGVAIFWLYGRTKGFSFKELALISFQGVKTVKNILITFMLIGMLTALWRAAGTIPFIVCSVTQLINPRIFILMTFLLNCLISLLIGTSFGTAATMGVICITMAATMDVNPVLVGGAVLGGAFFGDRCSPVSTSALLVSELTKTDIFDNIKNMVKSCVVPFVITCGIYLVMGLSSAGEGIIPDLHALFGREFRLHWVAVIPAAVIVVLSAFKVRVKAAMTVSILSALPICALLQNIPLAELPQIIVMGYTAQDAQVGAMMSGGGIVSMLRVAAIVCISSSYSGIFGKTGLFDGIKHIVEKLAERTNPFTSTLLTSFVAGAMACNQTLAIMLTHQLTEHTEKDNSRFALVLEDTVVVTAPLIPWSIASATPLAAIGGSAVSIPFAVFLWILPLWRTAGEMMKKQ
ncbi:MAG: sodium:proton antiporter [Ruminococcaceae bacterium]|nr:sodium:proton antiporter [Oscillospiraceae bacterium]